MGKYMRKCRGAAGAEVAAVEVTQVVGVRTRSRAASAAGATTAGGGVATKVVAKRRKALPPATEEAVAVGSGGDGGSCYLQLRSRMLFKAPSSSPQKLASALEAAADAAAGHGAPLAAVLSRCSSTASSVDALAQERSAACRCDGSETGGDHVPEGSVCNSGCGQNRERRETTPSSQAHGELSDLESDLAGQKSGRSSLPAAASSPVQSVRPPAAEIEEFFAAAEAAEAQRFASKYNFDVARGVPLAGRFEWTPVVSM